MKTNVLITGAAGGLGKAFSAECASRGWDLYLTDRSMESLEPLAVGITRMYGVDVQVFAADLTIAAERAALWAHVAKQSLRLHMLLNVAGLDYEGPFSERLVAEIRAILRLNVEATLEMTHHALNYRDPLRAFHIVNVSSLAAFYPMPLKAVYASSKRFLLDWSLALDQELRPSGISVLVLCPAGMPSNPQLVQAIEAQGVAGRITTVNVGTVASQALDQALEGRSICIPGMPSQVLGVLGRIVPPRVAAAAIGSRWRRAHERACGSHALSRSPSPETPRTAAIA